MWVYDVVPEGVLWRVSTMRCVVSSVNSDSQKEPVHSDGEPFLAEAAETPSLRDRGAVPAQIPGNRGGWNESYEMS